MIIFKSVKISVNLWLIYLVAAKGRVMFFMVNKSVSKIPDGLIIQ
jgi:hypothetical protein